MCLRVNRLKPFIASQDIYCWKMLTTNDLGGLCTPYRRTPVILGEYLTAIPESPNITKATSDEYNITSGVIHAYLTLKYIASDDCYLAMIPKGTEYWINILGTEIAARKMKILSKRKESQSLNLAYAKELVNNAPRHQGLQVTDFLVKDGWYVPCTKFKKLGYSEDDIIGRIVGFLGDKPLVSRLNSVFGYWEFKIKGFYYANPDCNSIFSKTGEFFGKKEYIPSKEEMGIMLGNISYLNAAAELTSIGEKITNDTGMYWTCTEYDSDKAYVSIVWDGLATHTDLKCHVWRAFIFMQ